MSAAPMRCTAPVGRSRCRTRARRIRSPTHSLKPPKQCGHRRNPDFNGSAQEGSGYYQTTTRNGRRCSTAAAYLKPARRRANLAVIPQRARDPRPVRRTPRRRRRIPGRGERRTARARARSDPCGRRLQLSAAAAVLRARAGGAAAILWHRGARRPPGRRRRAAGPLPGAAGVSAARSRSRSTTQSAACAARRRRAALRLSHAAACSRCRRSSQEVSSAPIRRSRRRTCRARSRYSRPTRSAARCIRSPASPA